MNRMERALVYITGISMLTGGVGGMIVPLAMWAGPEASYLTLPAYLFVLAGPALAASRAMDHWFPDAPQVYDEGVDLVWWRNIGNQIMWTLPSESKRAPRSATLILVGGTVAVGSAVIGYLLSTQAIHLMAT